MELAKTVSSISLFSHILHIGTKSSVFTNGKGKGEGFEERRGKIPINLSRGGQAEEVGRALSEYRELSEILEISPVARGMVQLLICFVSLKKALAGCLGSSVD